MSPSWRRHARGREFAVAHQLASGEVTGDLYGNRWRMGVSPFFGGGGAPATDSPWVPEAISIRVQSPSGAVISLETVRLQRKRQ